MKKLRIATRVSDLALWQAYHIKERVEATFPEIEVELNKIVSNGDKVLDKPLALIGGKGHFTKELEDAMLGGEADMAVHSLKDVPTYIPEGLELTAITQRQDQSDVFLSHKYKSLNDLPEGAVVGTTSLRRRMQLLVKRPDLKLKDLRGNVNTRLRKLALGIEIVQGNEKLREIAKSLNDEDTYLCTQIERDFISKIGAGCSAPVACNAVREGDEIVFRVMLGFPDGTKIMRERAVVPVEKSENLGNEIAELMIANGALELLADAEKIAFKVKCHKGYKKV